MFSFTLRYAFRSTEKVALQEIGPRFTLKLRSLRKGLPAVKNLGEVAKGLEFDPFEEPENQNKELTKDKSEGDESMEVVEEQPKDAKKTLPPKEDEFLWVWKVRCMFLGLFDVCADCTCGFSRSSRLRDVHSSYSTDMYLFQNTRT